MTSEDAKLPPVPGFFLAIGGGASTAGTEPNSPLKASQVALHRTAVDLIREARGKGAKLGVGACSFEYHAPGEDTDDLLAISKKLFVAGGARAETVKGFVFDTREKANDPVRVASVVESCAVVSLPGGDQTEMRNLWRGTKLMDAMRTLIQRGGGVMGKSAGAALQGTIGYFPRLESYTTTQDLLAGTAFKRGEVEIGPFADTLADLPLFYVETHSGDRERTPRALTVLAAWEKARTAAAKAAEAKSGTLRGNLASAETDTVSARAVGVVVDSDTAALFRYDSSVKGYTADVIGARGVEFLFPSQRSAFGRTRSGLPYYTDVVSHMLLDGARVVISGASRGRILEGSKLLAQTPRLPASQESRGSLVLQRCDRIPFSTIDGRYESDGERAGAVFFDAFDAVSGRVLSLGEVEFAYLSGDLRPRRGEGCGHWMTDAFNVDAGRPENRLNAQRYALGANYADFSMSLPAGMLADVKGDTFRIRSGTRAGSSVFLYDVHSARARGVSPYVYVEMGARGPVQTGSWESGTAHLLPPGASFDSRSHTVTLKTSR